MKTKTIKKTSLKQRKIFSESIRKQVVRDIENGKCSVTEASRELAVDTSAVYKWIHRYSRYLQKNKTLIVEEKSEAYRTKQLEQQIKDLQAALGRKQMEIDYLEKLIDVAGNEYKADLKKNFPKKASDGSKRIKGSNTDTK